MNQRSEILNRFGTRIGSDANGLIPIDEIKVLGKLLDEFAEFVAIKTFNYWSPSAFNDIHFNKWWKENESKIVGK
jgi:hypothetical protein